MNEITYVIFSTTELFKINFNEVLESSENTCRLSLDNSKTLVKWYSNLGIPSCVQDLTTKGLYMNHAEILEVMSTSEWTNPNPGI